MNIIDDDDVRDVVPREKSVVEKEANTVVDTELPPNKDVDEQTCTNNNNTVIVYDITETEKLLEQIASPSPTRKARHKQQCLEYKQRLQTYTPTSYFAKPIQISPILCAVTGWEVDTIIDDPNCINKLNTETVMLTCKRCSANIAILIPRKLSGTATKSLAFHYQEQLWKAHKEHCAIRKEAEYFIETTLKCQLTVPIPLARVLPYNGTSLQLVESLEPWSLVQERFTELYPIVHDLNNAQSVEIPIEVLSYCSKDETEHFSESLPARLLKRFQSSHSHDDDSDNNQQSTPVFETKAAEATMALILTGWDLHQQQSDNGNIDNQNGCDQYLFCVFCLSRQPLIETTSDEQTAVIEESRPPKRRKIIKSKWNQPISGHRYYCPWICGLPCKTAEDSKPLWQIMADKLLVKSTEKLDWTDIHKALKAGVSTKRITGIWTAKSKRI